MKNRITCSVSLLAAGAALALVAAPVVREGSVAVVRAGESPVYEIAYELENDPAVVTLDVLTNGVSIGAANFANVRGFGRVVQPGRHVCKWRARRTWPDQQASNLSVKVTAWALTCPPPFLVLSLDSETPPVYYADTNAIPRWGEDANRLYKTEKMVLRRIPAANVRWRRGAGLGEPGYANTTREVPHYVTLTKDYYMAIYPTTQEQYRRVTGNPGKTDFRRYPDFDCQPVGGVAYSSLRGRAPDVNWPLTPGETVAANSVIDQFRRKARCETLDLPTDAEWEFACRGGVEGYQLYTGKDLSGETVAAELDEIAWYGGNSDTEGVLRPHEVGCKMPNAYGLYDMLGNVREACLDWDYGTLSNSDGTPMVDPPGPQSCNEGSRRVYRGGSYDAAARFCCAASRLRNAVDNWDVQYGFRFKCAAVAE